jgi:hypothetical protein
MKVLRNSLVVATLLVASQFASAGGYIFGKVVQIRVDPSGLGMVTLNTAATGSPSCVIPYYSTSIAFNTNTAGGKSQLAVIMFSRAKGSNIAVWGAGTCTAYGGSVEDASTISELEGTAVR